MIDQMEQVGSNVDDIEVNTSDLVEIVKLLDKYETDGGLLSKLPKMTIEYTFGSETLSLDFIKTVYEIAIQRGFNGDFIYKNSEITSYCGLSELAEIPNMIVMYDDRTPIDENRGPETLDTVIEHAKNLGMHACRNSYEDGSVTASSQPLFGCEAK